MNTPLATAPFPVPTRSPGPERIASVDALRGLVITLMIFVNDVAGVSRAPGWLKHVKASDDAMTLPDIVFPAFLFIAGMSIPLALDRAAAQGRTRGQIFQKIVGRTIALLVMGVLMVNADEHNPWFRGAWGLLAYIAMLLAFVVVPPAGAAGRRAWTIVRAIGWLTMIALALLYTAPASAPGLAPHRLVFGPLFNPPDTSWLRHSWWGILGLIGWAYFIGSTLYLLLGRRREWLIGLTGLLMMLYVVNHADYASRLASRPWLEWAQPALAAFGTLYGAVTTHVSLGSLTALTMAGCCLGTALLPGSDIRTPSDRLRWTATFTAGLLAAAVLFDPLYGINKIQGTPTWCLLCAAIAAAGWMLLYWHMDVRGGGRWTRLVRPAGANPLLAYLLHPLLYYVAAFAAVPLDFYRAPAWPLAVNVGGSLLMAIAVVQLTGLLARTGYRLKV